MDSDCSRLLDWERPNGFASVQTERLDRVEVAFRYVLQTWAPDLRAENRRATSGEGVSQMNELSQELENYPFPGCSGFSARKSGA
jgi:hypothetical protein